MYNTVSSPRCISLLDNVHASLSDADRWCDCKDFTAELVRHVKVHIKEISAIGERLLNEMSYPSHEIAIALYWQIKVFGKNSLSKFNMSKTHFRIQISLANSKSHQQE